MPVNPLEQWISNIGRLTTLDQKIINNIIENTGEIVTHDTLRTTMKKMKYNRFYEEIPAIMRRYNNSKIEPLKIAPALMSDILLVHRKVLKLMPKRTSFSYVYFLSTYWKCRNLEQDLSVYNIYMRSNKYVKYDHIIEKICSETPFTYPIKSHITPAILSML